MAGNCHLQLAAPLPATLTLYYKPNQTDRRLAQTLQKQWKEVLGVTVQLEQLDLKSLAQRLQSRDYHLCLASWIAQFDDPICILERFKDRANLKNYPGWEDPVFAQLLQEAATSPHRLALLQQAESLMADQLPLLPLYHWRSPALCSSRLTSVSTTPCGGILFERFRFLKNICLQKKGI
jgi:oligopeptide transport system substrate-binding protein